MATAKPQVTYIAQPSATHPHIEWIELYGDGILHECAVMKRDAIGNVLYFRVNDLDKIDRDRLAMILVDRNARSMELWDLMSTRYLNNGVNYLEYFSQLVKQLTPNGKILDPRSGQVGVAAGTVRVTK